MDSRRASRVVTTDTGSGRTGGVRARWKARHDDDGGFVLIMLGLMVIPMMVFTALAVDVSAWYARANQMQKAADAAALAGTVWMPATGRATSTAADVLKQNGIISGQNNVTVTYSTNTTDNSLTVNIVDAKAPAFFSQVFAGSKSLARSATAKYFLPIPLGSPLNYYGGDSTKSFAGTAQSPQPAYQPPNYNFANLPNNYSPYGCNTAKDGVKYYYTGAGVLTPGELTRGTFPTCQWSYTPVDPIPASKSPGFWAAIEGPATDATNGDAYSPACYGNNSCTSNGSSGVTNSQYRRQPGRNGLAASNYSTGFWYRVDIPSGGVAGPLDLQVFDGSYDKHIGQTYATGDGALPGTSNVFTTTFQAFNTDSTPYDYTDNPAISGCQADVGASSFDLANYQFRWATFCRIVNPVPGGTYLINVRTSDPNFNGSGMNGYALRAVAGAGTGGAGDTLNGATGYGTDPQPALSALDYMGMYNNINGTQAEFFLAKVGAQFSGKVLVLDLWDPGDVNGNLWVTIMAPSSSALGGQAAPSCTWTRNNIGTPGGIGSVINGPFTQSGAAGCQIQLSGGSYSFNGKWIEIRVNIPAGYTCNSTANPVTTAGSCWWQILYNTSSQAHDVTTWAARVEGDPVHLTQ